MKQYALVFDLKRCIGCHTCTIACKMENAIRTGSWIHVDTIGGPHTDTPAGKYPDVCMHYLPKTCVHCKNPPCLSACPTVAIYRRPDGVVLIDKNRCNGCQLCIQACPYNAITFNPKVGVAEKCTLCVHRVDMGLEPFCVTCCITKAIIFGDANNPKSKASKLIRKRDAYVLQPQRGTQPSVYYCPP